jgi:hypothetical protein
MGRCGEGLDVKNVSTDGIWTCGEGLEMKIMCLQAEQNARLTGRYDVSFGESRKCSATPCGGSVPHILSL